MDQRPEHLDPGISMDEIRGCVVEASCMENKAGGRVVLNIIVVSFFLSKGVGEKNLHFLKRFIV